MYPMSSITQNQDSYTGNPSKEYQLPSKADRDWQAETLHCNKLSTEIDFYIIIYQIFKFFG